MTALENNSDLTPESKRTALERSLLYLLIIVILYMALASIDEEMDNAEKARQAMIAEKMHSYQDIDTDIAEVLRLYKLIQQERPKGGGQNLE